MLRRAPERSPRFRSAVPAPPPPSTPSLPPGVAALLPAKQAQLKEVNAKFGEKSLGNVTVGQAIGGMRDVKSMIWETSLLDAHEVRA